MQCRHCRGRGLRCRLCCRHMFALWQHANLGSPISSAGLGLDALVLQACGALSLGEGGLDEKACHSVGIHIGCRPPVLQVAIVLELQIISNQFRSCCISPSHTRLTRCTAVVCTSQMPCKILVPRVVGCARGAMQVNAESLIAGLECSCIAHGAMQVCPSTFCTSGVQPSHYCRVHSIRQLCQGFGHSVSRLCNKKKERSRNFVPRRSMWAMPT